MKYNYIIVIQWSEEDECFVVSLPEWGDFCHTHGLTYQEALKNAEEVLELLIESALENGECLPKILLYENNQLSNTRGLSPLSIKTLEQSWSHKKTLVKRK